MEPDRKKIVSGHTITEYWWAGKFVVYVDNRAYAGTFEEACAQYEEQPRHDD